MSLEDGGLETCEKMALPSGRSKNNPLPPRTTTRCVPVRSYAIPNRGATASAGHVYVVFAMPCPERNKPFIVLPEFGIKPPIPRVLFAPRNRPVTGSIAWRLAVGHAVPAGTVVVHPAT